MVSTLFQLFQTMLLRYYRNLFLILVIRGIDLFFDIWVARYKVIKFFFITQIFKGAVWEGNPMAYTIDPPINGKYIRVQPMTWQGDICMSIELYGCPG